MEIYLQDSQATEALGQALGKAAQEGDVFCLTGDLGTGKTLLTQGIASSLGINKDEVTSPTFAILNMYEGKELAMKHFDLYRLNRPEELEDIGFGEYAGGEGVTVIEWAELFLEEMPEEYLRIILQYKDKGRLATLLAQGSRYEDLLQEVSRNVNFSD